ncbi:MAG: glucose 1-dehydrogenase [Nitrospirae bacterium]|nr:MAG: glucose 1-dehydrogenase [Nitrospirota bacterium]
MQRFDLKGKVALVTGGNGGIGQGIARGLLECGAAVVIAGRNEEKNKAAVSELSKIGPPVSALVLDVTNEGQCRAAVEEVVRRHGRLDILVNNAGMGAPGGPALPDDMPLVSWHKVIDTNLTSAFVLSQLAYPEMKKVGGGKIINIGSISSYMGAPRWTAYGPAKAGIVQLSKNCASAWGKDNIQVNTIWPGLIDTAMTKTLQGDKAFMARVLPRIAAGRVGAPHDFAGVAAFLASRASDYVTGADITVDGGLLWGV